MAAVAVVRIVSLIPSATEIAFALGVGEQMVGVTFRIGRPRPRVLILEWPDPPFVVGHWVPELLVVAGGEVVLARAGERSVTTTWQMIIAIDPDVVVVSSCGFDMHGSAGWKVSRHSPCCCTASARSTPSERCASDEYTGG